ncbi:hypothetical protein [Caulobacter vibrioides]|jgi:hypothetical protein|uniref:Lipoprotein n=1 Tax=Caulobacter vibrioides OR37 TaxID=1292034 RepID=R0D233_CAUVI|nr:hypothetical protein [Caulobacter vibrioides]ENZ82515.1 hypothetical protein OR37_01447 [Caulobacter vibrioides OR37]
MSTKSIRLAALLASAAAVLGACATRDEVAALRQPPLPPAMVAKASPARAFYRNVVVQSVEGAPEFRWFDGGGVVTTRPTRVQVVQSLGDHLRKAEMLAPSRLDAEYMLYTTFEDLRGPNVWLGTDKLASARVTFRLVRWRTGEVVREKTIDAAYEARWTGVTPEIARAAIAGPLGVSQDRVLALPGGAIGGIALGYYVNQNLVVSIADAPYAGLVGAAQAATIGGPNRSDPGYAAAFASAVAVGTARGRFQDLEAMLAGGAISAAGAAMGPAPVGRATASSGEITTVFNGRDRRLAATRGLMDLAFDLFMNDLGRDGSVVYKTAVSCRALNGEFTHGPHLTETATAYAVDCPGATYNDAKTANAYPRKF